MNPIQLARAVREIRSLASSEHGGCPEEYTPRAIEKAIRLDGKIPSDEEMEWLVMGKEDEDGASVPPELARKYPNLNKLLESIF